MFPAVRASNSRCIAGRTLRGSTDPAGQETASVKSASHCGEALKGLQVLVETGEDENNSREVLQRWRKPALSVSHPIKAALGALL